MATNRTIATIGEAKEMGIEHSLRGARRLSELDTATTAAFNAYCDRKPGAIQKLMRDGHEADVFAARDVYDGHRMEIAPAL